MNAFQKTAITTVIAVLILIAVGSLVRVSGAGLGCPDWPRCWGCWLPPSGPGEIDPAYLAERGLDIKDFNPVKMWIEYTNRMVGVTIGLLVFATFLRALPYRKTRPEIFWGSLAAVLLVGFEGWLGGQVVRSGLKPGMITLHMVGAVVLLCVLLHVTFRAFQENLSVTLTPDLRHRLLGVSILLFVIICIQTLLGTQVREAIDPYIKNAGGVSRSAWVTNVGWADHIHRSFTWLLLAAAIYLIYLIRRHAIRGFLRRIAHIALLLVVLQAGIGITLAYGGLPHVFQVLHLLAANLLICAVFTLLLTVRRHSAA